ncbi:MAG: phosphatidylserine decarboxylase [Candidatus Symbiobacter sp.]|nr:phosphatidylserine decarboxylase [Candidatus Symbiobacter sp.]
MSSLVQQMKPTLHPAGRIFIAIFAAITLLLFWLWQPLGWVGLVLTLWCAWFFRDPVRVTPDRPGLIIAPADGVVMLIEPAAPPPELGYDMTPLPRISIFMSVFDVHVNRAPAAAKVERIAYRAGKFFNAALDKASQENERSSMLLKLEGLDKPAASPESDDELLLSKPHDLIVVQIAGLIARRILSFVAPGAALQAGQRYGMIRFGSRVDVYLPAGTTPLVAEGQRAIAGETILADLGPPSSGQASQSRSYRRQ